VSGAQRARDQVDAFGKLFFELPQPLAAARAAATCRKRRRGESVRPIVKSASHQRERARSQTPAAQIAARTKVPTSGVNPDCSSNRCIRSHAALAAAARVDDANRTEALDVLDQCAAVASATRHCF
jgi:hypothetical protein